MNLETFRSQIKAAGDFVKAGKYDNALETLNEVIGSDVPDLDRSAALVNMAAVFGKIGDAEKVLTSFDAAINIESKYKRFSAMESKAAYLAGAGRLADSLRLYLQILHRTDLTLEDISRIDRNIDSIRDKIHSGANGNQRSISENSEKK